MGKPTLPRTFDLVTNTDGLAVIGGSFRCVTEAWVVEILQVGHCERGFLSILPCFLR